ncbi:MarR family winged helix-turn-helix transcriptional regulator [Arthrobacter koreensis]|uniref:MarR family winged helix-turn-helix transcriptional regulator n=1 Tax=Arthrobacter koreensis TaxID=199136 RepID=UPI002DB5E31A|nr:MarR family transcriptional regulator [Arthrobacter koreensis]MEB7446403.1 MarR family transcriptional regulator [Arthrobacter koreensis]
MSFDESLQLSRELRPMLPRLYHLSRRRIPGWDLTTSQSSAMSTLVDRGPLRMSELAALEGVQLPSATSVVNGLVKLGLVERRADPADRRAVVIDLTPKGRRQVDELVDRRNHSFALLLDRLDEQDRRLLEDAVPAVARLLSLGPDMPEADQPGNRPGTDD